MLVARSTFDLFDPLTLVPCLDRAIQVDFNRRHSGATEKLHHASTNTNKQGSLHRGVDAVISAQVSNHSTFTATNCNFHQVMSSFSILLSSTPPATQCDSVHNCLHCVTNLVETLLVSFVKEMGNLVCANAHESNVSAHFPVKTPAHLAKLHRQCHGVNICLSTITK